MQNVNPINLNLKTDAPAGVSPFKAWSIGRGMLRVASLNDYEARRANPDAAGPVRVVLGPSPFTLHVMVEVDAAGVWSCAGATLMRADGGRVTPKARQLAVAAVLEALPAWAEAHAAELRATDRDDTERELRRARAKLAKAQAEVDELEAELARIR